jgi:hypothetical protein
MIMQFPCHFWVEHSITDHFKMIRLNNKFIDVQYGYLKLFIKAAKFTKSFP